MLLISTVLAGYKENSEMENDVWKDLCERLRENLKDPYLKAIFSFISSGNWMNIIYSSDLPLSDRAGLALRYLTDEKVTFIKIFTS